MKVDFYTCPPHEPVPDVRYEFRKTYGPEGEFIQVNISHGGAALFPVAAHRLTVPQVVELVEALLKTARS